MTVDYRIFCLRPHFLSVDCRKSRSNLFSILSRCSSFSMFCLGGCPSFRGLPLGLGAILLSRLRPSQLCLYDQFLSCLWLSPSSSAISWSVIPSCRMDNMSPSTAFRCVYFRFCITIPPVQLLSYTGGLFVYCPVLLVRCNDVMRLFYVQ